jgi:PNKP adenylyltransferase domain, ligase domain/PNKP adenylyltransferase domain, C-terminal region
VARGRRGLTQPAVKCRGPEYLRIIYGPEYLSPENLEGPRSRGVSTKRSLALRESALGVEALERFVRNRSAESLNVFSVSSLLRVNPSTLAFRHPKSLRSPSTARRAEQAAPYAGVPTPILMRISPAASYGAKTRQNRLFSAISRSFRLPSASRIVTRAERAADGGRKAKMRGAQKSGLDLGVESGRRCGVQWRLKFRGGSA